MADPTPFPWRLEPSTRGELTYYDLLGPTDVVIAFLAFNRVVRHDTPPDTAVLGRGGDPDANAAVLGRAVALYPEYVAAARLLLAEGDRGEDADVLTLAAALTRFRELLAKS